MGSHSNATTVDLPSENPFASTRRRSSPGSATAGNLPTETPFAEPRPHGGRHGGRSGSPPFGRRGRGARAQSDDEENARVVPLPMMNPFAAREENRNHYRIVEPVYPPTDSEEEEEEEEEEEYDSPPLPRRANLAGSGRPAPRASALDRPRSSAHRDPGHGRSNGHKGFDQEDSHESSGGATTLSSVNPFAKSDVTSPTGQPRAKPTPTRESLAQSDEDFDEDFDDLNLDEAIPSPTDDSFSTHEKKSPIEKPNEVFDEKEGAKVRGKDGESPEVIYVELPRENPFARRGANIRRPVQRPTGSKSDE
ncbi:hypothetical protein B0J17DRAFT_226058 [Rhizoctonia solani]|nr:hypothetical protein B0J17DRAFT_226058 [Rhizoctonia solani]